VCVSGDKLSVSKLRADKLCVSKLYVDKLNMNKWGMEKLLGGKRTEKYLNK